MSGERTQVALRRMIAALGDLLYPPRCQVCDRFSEHPLCDPCRKLLTPIEPPYCERCGKPFDPNAHAAPVCAACAGHRGPLLWARSFGLHVGALRDAVNAYKFARRIRLSRPLGELLPALVTSGSPAAGPDAAVPSLIVPVPLHLARRRWRGFDQAELLSVALGEATGLPVGAGRLTRTRNTRPQIGLAAGQRAANVRGAFSAPSPLGPGERVVLLVDDVYTTGATLRECARVLRRAGAEAVCAVTVSRAAPEWHPQADLVRDV